MLVIYTELYIIIIFNILDYVWNQFFKYDKAARRREPATVPPRRCETRRFSQVCQPNPKPRASLAKSAAPGACHNLPLSQQGSAAEGAWAGQLGNWMHDWM